MFRSVRNGLLVIASALVAAALRVWPDNQTLAVSFLALAAIIGVALIVWAIARDRGFRRIRDALGGFMKAAYELTHRETKTQQEFDKWTADLNEWFRGVQDYLRANLSIADVQIFINITEGASYSIHPAFSNEHVRLLNALRVYIANLRTITERFLAARD